MSVGVFALILSLICIDAFGFGRAYVGYSADETHVSQSTDSFSLRSSAGSSDSGPLSITACDGLRGLVGKSATKKAGVVFQDLTQKGYSLDGVAPAFQGIRVKRFGSCSMAGSLTMLNAYFNAKQMYPKPKGNSRFNLGKQHEWYTASFNRLKGGWDEAVENNFETCFGRKRIRANAASMSGCLNGLLSKSECNFKNTANATDALNALSRINTAPSLQCESENIKKTNTNSQCAAPGIIQADDSIRSRIAFVQKQFNNPDGTKILPITMAWDTGVADGDFQGSLNHISNIIGRRLLPDGRCQLLVRNSYSNFCVENKDYPYGKCNSPGKTDDFWVDADRLLHHSGDYMTLNL